MYWHGDRLGSPAAKSNAIATVTERHGFDAWGSGRTDTWAPRPYGRLGSTHSPRGFTGHEHLDAVGGLIHMNGRAYDPNLGRFLSVDPVIQFPANSQSLNPYSYIMNNPMAGTDPTGYCSAPVGSKIRTCDVKITQVSSDGSQRTEKYNSRNDADMASAASSVTAAAGRMIESGAPKAGAIPASKGGNNVSQAEGSTTGAAASETIESSGGIHENNRNPRGISDEVVRNRKVDERARLIEIDGVKALNLGSYTVSHDPSITNAEVSAYLETAQAGWTTSVVDVTGVVLATSVELSSAGSAASLRRSGADFHIAPCNISTCVTGLGAARLGGRTLYYSQSQLLLTPVHEFGHIFGLRHQSFLSKSIMSNHRDRAVMPQDLNRLIEAYGE